MTDFLRPRLIGSRFEGHAIPLEFLRDLAVLEEMIVEVAKCLFRNEHPERKRSPRGFTEGIQLRLTGVEEGSAIPVIKLLVATGTLFPSQNQEYSEKARDAIVNAISAAEHNEDISQHLPENALAYFDKLGRSLREGEAIEFELEHSDRRVRLTKEIRRKLLLHSPAVKELTEEVSIRGAIPEADQGRMKFQIQLSDGSRVQAPITAQHFATILEAFNGYRTGSRVSSQGIAKFDRLERLKSFESVEHISVLDPLDVASRLEEIGRLEDGWLDGRGIAPNRAGLVWLAQQFDQRFSDGLPLPHVFPTAEGGILAEWSLDPSESSLEIDLSTHSASWHSLNLQTGEEIVQELALDRSEDWKWITETIADLSGVRV